MAKIPNKKIPSDFIHELVTRTELANRWKVSVETIKRRERDGTLNPVFLPGGRLIRYRIQDVIELEMASSD